MTATTTAKEDVLRFWEEASCGEKLYLQGYTREDYQKHSQRRYELEPDILRFGEFARFRGKKTLEIGVGLGSDHQQLAEAGAILTGIDLTPRAVGHTQRRFELFGLKSELQVGDAENLPFPDASFDAVYSWGVLHHSPDTQKAIQEVHRVLKPGGFAKIMIYHKYSMVGYMLWIRYALLRLKPFTGLDEIYSRHLESSGTKAYSRKQARELFSGFRIVSLETPLTHADLLTSDVGQRHRGAALNLAKALWPRPIIRSLLPQHGLGLMVEAVKDK
jgi:ubiquinone/menaquinone biosynthesis C-methylase UbiE